MQGTKVGDSSERLLINRVSQKIVPKFETLSWRHALLDDKMFVLPDSGNMCKLVGT